MSTQVAEPVRTDPKPRQSRQLGWVIPLIAVALLFVGFTLPLYVTGDPSRSRVPTHPDLWWYYPLLVAHIGFGSVALLAGSLQLWPWFRQRHPVAHRWLGRAYVFAGVLPAGVAVLAIAPLASTGLVTRFSGVVQGLLWLAFVVAGYRMARQRRYAEHRRWMIRGFAMTTAIVVNRIWAPVLLLLFSPESLQPHDGPGMVAADDHTGMAVIGISNWLSWTVNLLVAEWWLERTDIARRHRARTSRRKAVT